MCLALAMDSLSIDLFYVIETRIQSSKKVIKLASHGFSLGYFVHTSEDEAVRVVDRRGVGTVPTDKAEASLSDHIPVI